jgi:hypothetical protein
MDAGVRNRGGDLQLASREAGCVARYLARERQKAELRRERDVVVLAVAKDLGERALADRMGVAPDVIGKVVADAHDRLDGSLPDARGAITARRLSSPGDRWADADAHYEALASGPQLTARRRLQPLASPICSQALGDVGD